MAKKRYELTEAEWDIIEAVWESQPCAAPTVTEALKKKKSWSYSTVKTLMDRMVKKGLLKTERIRNIILYSASITKKQAQRTEVMKTVKRAFNGAMTPMMQFMLENNKLSKNELEELEKLIKLQRNKGAKAQR